MSAHLGAPSLAVPETDLQSWPQRYRRLLAESGLDGDDELAAALLAPINASPPALFSLAQCLRQPDLLHRQILRDYPEEHTRQAITARLSVLQQDLALNIISPLTLRLFLHGEAPLPDPESVFLGRVGEYPSRWFHASTPEPVTVAPFVHGVGELLNDWYPVFRQSLGVSPGAYWSSMGLGLGAPFSLVWNRARPASVCDLAREWLSLFAGDSDRFIQWIPAELSNRQCAIPQRKGCCLKYLLPEGGYCGTCGIYRKERLAALNQTQAATTAGRRGNS